MTSNPALPPLGGRGLPMPTTVAPEPICPRYEMRPNRGMTDAWPAERRAQEKAQIAAGLEAARAWRREMQPYFDALCNGELISLLPRSRNAPTAAIGSFPYPHRTVAEVESQP